MRKVRGSSRGGVPETCSSRERTRGTCRFRENNKSGFTEEKSSLEEVGWGEVDCERDPRYAMRRKKSRAEDTLTDRC